MPRLSVLADVQAAALHMEIRQITGGWGKTSLVTSKRQDDSENRRRVGLVSEIVDFVRINSGDNALVVTYEAIEERFAGPGIRTGHFNAISGLDTFGEVRSLFVIGRPLADARELRASALALTGRAIPLENGQVETRGVLMADGSGAGLGVRTYADPDLEALRVAVTDAEVVQAIGRGRGVNRTASNPLTVFVMADVTLPLPVTRLCRWTDVRLDVMARMLARGIMFLGASDAARAYPDLFSTPDAARMAIQRIVKGGYFPNISLGECTLGRCSGNRLIEVSYRLNGRGQQNRSVLVLERRLKGLREQLESLLGPLVHYELVEPSPPSPSAPQPTPHPSSPSPATTPQTEIAEEPEWVEESEVTDGPAATEPVDFLAPWPGEPSGSLWASAAALGGPGRPSWAREAPCVEVAGDGDWRSRALVSHWPPGQR